MPVIEIYHCAIPAHFPRSGCAPAISVNTAPNVCIEALAELDVEMPDCGFDYLEYMESRTAIIWFFDRAGWKEAWRLARIIAGGLIKVSELRAAPVGLLIDIPQALVEEAA